MTTAIARRQESATITVRDDLTEGLSFDDLVRMGEQLVRTGFLPDHLKNGAQVAAVVLTGRELGMTPMRAVRSLSMVKGKVVESADSQLARFKADGGRAVFRCLDDERAELWLRHPNGDEHTETFTMADAKRAGLLSSGMYAKYPRAMLRSRCITAGLKSVGWEGAIGAYDPDEAREIGGSAAAPEPEPAPVATVVEPPPAPRPARVEAVKERVAASGPRFSVGPVVKFLDALDRESGADGVRELVEDFEDEMGKLPGDLFRALLVYRDARLAALAGKQMDLDDEKKGLLARLEKLRGR